MFFWLKKPPLPATLKIFQFKKLVVWYQQTTNGVKAVLDSLCQLPVASKKINNNMNREDLKPGPSAVGGPRDPNAKGRGGGTAADQLKNRLYTQSGPNSQSMQQLPGNSSLGSRLTSSTKHGSQGARKFAGRSTTGLVPRGLGRGGMKTSRSVPALGGTRSSMVGSLGGSQKSSGKSRKGLGIMTNNFLPNVSDSTTATQPPAAYQTNRGLGVPSEDQRAAEKTEAEKSESESEKESKRGAAPVTVAAPSFGKKRRTDQTFTQMLQLDKATLREFLRGDFLYLKADSGAVSVYDLHVVDHEEIVRDQKSGRAGSYWTMSRAGLTQFFYVVPDAIGPDAEKDPEFTNLEVWERDFHIFNIIQGIRFFQQYPMWKTFRTWSKGMKRRKMQTASRGLNQKLFLLNSTLRSSMSQLRRLCVDVSQLGLFKMPTKEDPIMTGGAEDNNASGSNAAKTRKPSLGGLNLGGAMKKDNWQPPTVDDFLRAQVKKRALLADWLLDFSDDVRALVRSACDQVLDAFLARNHIEADHPMTFTEKAALRTECRRLVKFVRLCDMLIRDTLLEVGIESTEALLEYLHPTVPAATVTIVHELEEPSKGKKKEREVKDFDEDGHRVYEDGTTSEDERDEEEKLAQKLAAAAHPCEVRLMLQTEMSVKQIEKVSPREFTEEEATAIAAAETAAAEEQAAAAAAVAAVEAGGAGGDEADDDEEEEAVEEEEEFVKLCEADIHLTVSEDFLVEELLQCIDDGIRVLAVPEPIMSHEDLQPYVRGANAEGSSGSDGEGGGGGEFRCTDEYEAKGARISFPSNHASGSFCGMLLLSLYLEHCFRTIITHPTIATKKTLLRRKKLRRRQQQIQDHAKKGLQRLVSLFCYTPMLFAVFIAASRVVDNRHFPADVVGGAVLGASIASLVFNIWYVISL